MCSRKISVKPLASPSSLVSSPAGWVQFQPVVQVLALQRRGGSHARDEKFGELGVRKDLT